MKILPLILFVCITETIAILKNPTIKYDDQDLQAESSRKKIYDIIDDHENRKYGGDHGGHEYEEGEVPGSLRSRKSSIVGYQPVAEEGKSPLYYAVAPKPKDKVYRENVAAYAAKDVHPSYVASPVSQSHYAIVDPKTHSQYVLYEEPKPQHKPSSVLVEPKHAYILEEEPRYVTPLKVVKSKPQVVQHYPSSPAKSYVHYPAKDKIHDEVLVKEYAPYPAHAKEYARYPAPAKEYTHYPAPAKEYAHYPAPAAKDYVHYPAPAKEYAHYPAPAAKDYVHYPAPAKDYVLHPAPAKDYIDYPAPAKEYVHHPAPVKHTVPVKVHDSHYDSHHKLDEKSHQASGHGHYGDNSLHKEEGHKASGKHEIAGHKAHSASSGHHDKHDHHHDKAHYERDRGYHYEKAYAYDRVRATHDIGSKKDSHDSYDAKHSLEGHKDAGEHGAQSYAYFKKHGQHGDHGYHDKKNSLYKTGHAGQGYHSSYPRKYVPHYHTYGK